MFTTDPTETPFVSTGSQAARLLEIAANSADQLVAEAKAEAASVVATAHADADQLTAASQAEADQLTSSARAEADQLLAAARTEAQRVNDEVEQHRVGALADVAEAKATLEAQVDQLQQLEREHVERMRSYLTGQLDQLERVARTDEATVGSVDEHTDEAHLSDTAA